MKRLHINVLLVGAILLLSLSVSALELAHSPEYYSEVGASMVIRACYTDDGQFLACLLEDNIAELQNSDWAEEGGKVYKEFVLTEDYHPYPAHDLVHHDAKAATCTEIGWEAYDTCTQCDYTTYSETPALGHNYAYNFLNEWQIELRCTECGDVSDTLTFPEYAGMTYKSFTKLSNLQKITIENNMGEDVYNRWVLYLKEQQEAIEFGGEV